MITTCPRPNELADFVVGKLTAYRGDEIGDHLQECTRCLDTLDHLEEATLAFRTGGDQDRQHDFARHAQDVVSHIREQSSAESQVSPPTATCPGQIGPYRILSLLGRGGMGAVYRAIHARLDREVALKVLAESRMEDRGAIARFEREMRALGPLDHENVVKAYDADESDGIHYLVMEYVDGVDLSRVLRAVGPLDASAACELVRQAAVGLEYIHQNGRVHRDIKPSNLMLCVEESTSTAAAGGQLPYRPKTKILDLGLALLQERSAREDSLTSAGQLMGTLDYMAPEQAVSTRDVDIRADIYSLGATLYKLLTGRSPLQRLAESSELTKLDVLLRGKPLSLAVHRPDLPGGLVRVVERMLRRQPKRRYATPQQVADALEPFARGEKLVVIHDTAKAAAFAAASDTSRQISTWHSRAPETRRRRRNAGILIGLAALALMPLLLMVPWKRFAGGPDPLSTLLTEFAPATRLLHHGPSTDTARTGYAIALEGDVAVVGAPGLFGKEKRSGATFVLQLDRQQRLDSSNPGTWRLAQRLMPPEESSATTDTSEWRAQFGEAVAICGDHILVGSRTDSATGRRAGIAYLYQRNESGWVLRQQLMAPDGCRGAEGDEVVAMSKHHIAIAGIDALDRSVVHIYTRDTDSDFQYEQTLEPERPNTKFGHSLAIDGKRIAVAVQLPERQGWCDQGAVVFRRDQQGWIREQAITVHSDDRLARRRTSVALEADTLIIGSPADFAANTVAAGAVHILHHDGQRWQHQQKLTANQPIRNASFGRALALKGTRLLVSAQQADANGRGCVYTFALRGQQWEQIGMFLSDANHDEWFGHALAMDGGRAMIGAPKRSNTAREEGALWFLHQQDGVWHCEENTWYAPNATQSLAVPNTQTGTAIATWGKFTAVSAANANTAQAESAGAVHVFHKQGVKPVTVIAPRPLPHYLLRSCLGSPRQCACNQRAAGVAVRCRLHLWAAAGRVEMPAAIGARWRRAQGDG